MRGGQSLDEYAKVNFEFTIPRGCVFARLRFIIEEPAHRIEADAPSAYLFFTHVSLSMAGDSGAAWRPSQLRAHQIAALSGHAAIVDVTMPRFSSNAAKPAPTIDVVDTLTGTSIQNSPFVLPIAAAGRISVTSFDGVTFAGELSGVSTRVSVDLIIDEEVVQQRHFDVNDDGKSLPISFRIPDRFLDGNPHVVELRDAVTGATFFINAVTLKALSTSWEQVDDLGRLALPVELHPMSRRRYVNLLAHMRAGDPKRQGAALPCLQTVMTFCCGPIAISATRLFYHCRRRANRKHRSSFARRRRCAPIARSRRCCSPTAT